jgi:hypothetical protein
VATPASTVETSDGFRGGRPDCEVAEADFDLEG